ncbi:MAG: Zn-dependent hydrolase [Mariprofundaceae bacterium]|nr:Zn-dependent hydrolase [Mariprofundaceae bacterium]
MLMPSSHRVMQRLRTLAKIGAEANGGITRLAFTRQDEQARALVQTWMEEAGLQVHTDSVGNLCGRTTTTHGQQAVVMSGSHIDSVRHAGYLDGTLGVLAAIEVADAMNHSKHKWQRPLEVVAFAMEESSRFQCYAFGSKAMAGIPQADTLLGNCDDQGITLAAALCNVHHQKNDNETQQLQQARQHIQAAIRPQNSIHAFVELHIEQGPVLAAENIGIGLVTAIAAPIRLNITIHGMQNHSGTTPMHLRSDALTAAAALILTVESLCANSLDVRGTVATISNEPNIINAIPGMVQLGIDLRSGNSTERNSIHQVLGQHIKRMAEQRHVRIKQQVITQDEPVTMSPALLNNMEALANNSNIRHRRLASGAGHDAASISRIATHCGMIFIASKDGISHHPKESSNETDIAQGIELLHATLTALRLRDILHHVND